MSHFLACHHEHGIQNDWKHTVILRSPDKIGATKDLRPNTIWNLDTNLFKLQKAEFRGFFAALKNDKSGTENGRESSAR